MCRLAITSLLVLLLCVGRCLAQESNKCDAILKDGIFAVIKLKKGEDFHHSYEEWISNVSDDEVKQKLDTGAEIVLPIGGVPTPMKGSESYSKWQKFRQESKKGVHVTIDRKSFFDYFSTSADANIVAAWTKCIETQAKGLQLTVQDNGDQSTLTLEWNSPGNIVLDPLRATNADFLDPASEKMTLPSKTPKRIRFARPDSAKATVIIVDGDKDSAERVIPGKQQNLQPIFPGREARLIAAKNYDIYVLQDAINPHGGKLRLEQCFGTKGKAEVRKALDSDVEVVHWQPPNDQGWTGTDSFTCYVINEPEGEKRKFQVSVKVYELDKIPTLTEDDLYTVIPVKPN
jgi:hypothetical protein